MKKIFTIIFVLFSSLVFAQQIVNIELDWQEITSVKTLNDLSVNYIYFEGSSMDFEYASLPVFTYETKLPNEVYTYELEIINAVCDTLSIADSELISDADLVSYEFEHWIKKNGTDAILSILPLKWDNSTSQIILLKKFDILLSLVPEQEKQSLAISQPSYSDNSVLAQGQWFKLGIVNTGIHKIDWDFIVSMGMDPANIDVSKIGVFGNYEGMLPEDNGKDRADDLQENSVDFVGMEDGIFDEDDYILFYAQSQEKWRFNPFSGRFDHSKNLYADTVYYFFSPDQGNMKSIILEENLNVSPTEVVTTFVDYLAHENDFVNLMFTGKEWFGETLTQTKPEMVFTHTIPNLINEEPIYFQFDIVARSFENTSYEVFVNEEIVIDSTRISKVPNAEGIYARRSLRTETFFNSDEDILNVKPVFNATISSATAWINYYVFNFERELIFEGGQLKFRQPSTAAAGNKSRFEIRGDLQNIKVWDITDCHNPLEVDFVPTDEKIEFTLATDLLREFVAFNSNDFMQPVSFKSVDNQNLHAINSIDFIIICPIEFREQAERLAQIHTEHDGLNTIVLAPETIYNEFSSGSQDVSAIRDFMRMLYKKEAFVNGPGYLLMFGDGSFDYKHRVHENTNFVPTYESKESLRSTTSYVTDDYFGLLDDNEGAYCDGVLDIGIGRFPIKNLKEAKSAVDKIENYLSRDAKTVNNWTKTICFVADDGDNNLHFRQADLQLAPIVDTLHSGFNINKIYSDSYQKIEVPGGYRYPDVNLKIMDQVETGALIVNYTGHGGLIGWSGEAILDVPTINSFSNFSNLPLFVTATCEFSRFDNPEFTSAGEYLFLNEEGGGIALLTTTRLAYAHANIIVNMRVYNNLLEREDGSIPRLGDIIRMAKNPSSTNFLNFTLLGDPALQLAFPEKEIEILSINNKNVGANPDTVNALMEVKVEGIINDIDRNINTDFSGYIYPVIYDKPSQYQTLGNQGGSYPASFELEDKILYQGKSTITNGEFSFTFLVPKDISYNYGFGKMSFYAYDTVNFVDGWGGYQNIVVGGFNEDAEDDGIGPDISLFINDRNFETGDQVSNNLILIADLFDENGISATGNGLGRDIVAVIDEKYSNSMILNTYFNSDVDTYKKGSLSVDLGALEGGWHTINIKVWDLMNNSSNQTIDFFIGEENNPILTGVYNYPNPFNENTTFTFKYNGNNELRDFEIGIFNINGQYVTSLFTDVENQSTGQSIIEWNGTDHNGNKLPRGVYLYNILITDVFGNTSIQQQKMIKLSN